VLDHVAVYTNLAEELRNLESPVTEQQLVVKIIQTLPPSFRSFRSAWGNLPRNEQTIANLTPRLVNEEAISRAANNGAMDPTDAAFFAFHTPKAAAFAGESAAKTSPGQSFDNAAHAQGGFCGCGRGSYFTGEWRGRGRGRGGRGGRGGGSSNPHNHSYARKDGHQQNDQQQSSQHAGSVVCFNCNGNGHKAYQCYQQKEKKNVVRRDKKISTRKEVLVVSLRHCVWLHENTRSGTLIRAQPIT
jgi:hypothetical protein